MTIAQIQYFLEVAKEESFSRAAEKLYVSHQALSNHIKALEKELGIRLLDRSNKRKVVLTDAGRILFDAWTEVNLISKEAIEQARKIQESEERSFVIGIQDMKFVRSYVVPLIRKLQDSSDGITLEYRLGTPVEMLYMLERGTVDMLIMISSDLSDADRFYTEVLCKEALHLVIAMSKKHHLSKRKKLSLKDLENETILMIDSSYSGEAAKRFQKDILEHDFHPKKIRTFNGPRAINIAMETNLGVGLVFDELIEEARDEIVTFPVVLNNAEGTDMLLVWKNPKLQEAAKRIANLSKES